METFASRLHSAAVGAPSTTLFRGIAEISAAVQAVEELLGNGEYAIPEIDDLTPAVRRLRTAARLSQQERALCSAGAAIPIDGVSILESLADTEHLLSEIDRAHTTSLNRSYGRLFQCLAASYFAWAPGDRKDPTTPWATVREWLLAAAEEPKHLGVGELWNRVHDHRDVFTSDPCARYVRLQIGDPEVVQLQRDFAIRDDSWFFDDLLRAQLEALCRDTDSAFVDGLENAITALNDCQPDVVNWGLAALLQRYEGASFRFTPHQALCELALSRWQTPRDDANRERWSAVPEATREMVARWLAGPILEEVFNVFQELAPEGEAEDRAEYWRKWVPQIDEFHIFVDPESRRTFSEVVRLVGESHVAELSPKDSDSNNGLLMFIGPYAFMEFSHAGNGLYPYRLGRYEHGPLPFDLTEKTFRFSPVVWGGDSNSGDQVKDRANSIGGSIWAHGDNWQQRFDLNMASLGLEP